MVVDNPLMNDAHGLLQLWLHPKPDPYPITLTALWLQWHLGGGTPLIFHVISVLTHALGAVLFWRVLLRLSIPAAWFIAALFAVHPVCAASAAWITEQKNTISIIFYLATLLLYLRYEQTGKRANYWFALVTFICALLSKGSVVVLPVVLVLILWWRNLKSPQKIRRYIPVIPFFLLAMGGAVMVVLSQQKNAIGFATVQHMDGLERVLTAAREIWLYVWKDIAPVKLAPVYPKWRVDANDGAAYLPFLGLCTVLAVCCWFRKRWGSRVLIACGIFVISLLPVLGFVDMSFLSFSRTADHLQYLALLAFLPLAVGLARFCFQVVSRRVNISPIILPYFGAVMLLSCFLLTWQRASIYSTNEQLWSDAARKYPNAWMACINMGNIYLEKQKFLDAIKMYSRATAAEPGYFEGENGLGKTFESMGKPADAIVHFQAAARIVKDNASPVALAKAKIVLPELKDNPDLFTAHRQLAMMLIMTARGLDALAHFRAMVALQPQSFIAHGSLANVLGMLGFNDAAIEEFRTATQLQPADPRAHYNLAMTLVNSGRSNEALLEFQRCTALAPGNLDYRVAYTDALIKAGKPTEAMQQLDEARRIDPQNPAVIRLVASLPQSK